tara:strand:+ start:1400 stop:2326 length:927 start_codon:yes stop_codon:yes gene_type:complete
MATFVNPLRLTELATGEGSGTWGTTTNTNLELIGEALGYGTQDCFASDADATTTIADGAVDPARSLYFKVTSSATLTATRTLTIAPNTINRVMFIENATTGSQSITISQGSGTTVTIGAGATKSIYLDGGGTGANVVEFGSVDLEAVETDILPNTDDNNDLGSSSKRWQDLYLSGGMYLGGTTSANFLDDYEEGTWSPTLLAGMTGTISTITATYTKVGRQVSVRLVVDGTSLAVSSACTFRSLPFTIYNPGGIGLDFFAVSGNGWTLGGSPVNQWAIGASLTGSADFNFGPVASCDKVYGAGTYETT